MNYFRIFIGSFIVGISLVNITFVYLVDKSSFTYNKKVKYLTISNNVSKCLIFVAVVNFIFFLFF